jgi:hypothetical protein
MWPIIMALTIFGISKTIAYFGPMKTLIIHPEDSTTTFLSQIYAQLTNKTLIRGGISKSQMTKLIESQESEIHQKSFIKYEKCGNMI